MKTVKNLLPTVARVLLGLSFFVFGLNGFLHFLPNPPHPAAADQFLGALFGTGYMFPLIKGTEVLAGIALLSNRFVPLGLTLLGPVLVNIIAFHAFLAPEGLGLVVGLLVLELFVAWSYRASFKGVLAARATAHVSAATAGPASALTPSRAAA